MNWTDETLMAYADGELDDTRSAALEQALAGDATLQARVAALRAQRQRLAAAFAPVLEEPVPDRLAGLLAAAAPPAPVLDLAAARAARSPRPMPSRWAQWGGLAASLVLGVVIGMQMPGGGDELLGLGEGRVVAGGALDQALSRQLAGDGAAAGPVAVQLSFVDRAGAYCRTFSAAAWAGLACRREGQWAVQTLAAVEGGAAPGAMRQAATALPRAVLEAVDARIAGEALDATRERAARDQGWRR